MVSLPLDVSIARGHKYVTGYQYVDDDGKGKAKDSWTYNSPLASQLCLEKSCNWSPEAAHGHECRTGHCAMERLEGWDHGWHNRSRSGDSIKAFVNTW